MALGLQTGSLSFMNADMVPKSRIQLGLRQVQLADGAIFDSPMTQLTNLAGRWDTLIGKLV